MKISATPVFVRQENVDTDQIIPARFLKVTDKTGIGRHLFADRPDLRVEAGHSILVAAHNFGCGSSREHAVWALTDFGIRAVISTGFADIFRQNALKNRLLPIVVSTETLERIRPDAELTIDLPHQTLSIQNGPSVPFAIDSFSKTCILENLDELGYILKHEASISAFENNRDHLAF